MRFIKISLFLSCLMPVMSVFAGSVIHVKPVASGSFDGSSFDNAMTLDAAVTEANASGALINLYPGSYVPSTALSFSSPVSLIGLGKGVTTITSATGITLGASASGSRLAGFTLAGAGTTGIAISSNASNVMLEQLSVSGFATGVSVNGTGKDNKIVDSNIVSTTGPALTVAGAGKGYVSNSIFNSSGTNPVVSINGGSWSFYSTRVESTCTSECNSLIIQAVSAGVVQFENTETRSAAAVSHFSAGAALQIDNHLFRNCDSTAGGPGNKVTGGSLVLAQNSLCINN